MAYKGFVGSGTIGHFQSITALQNLYPADMYAGRMATVEVVAGSAAHYYSNGISWQPNAMLATDSNGKTVGIAGGDGVVFADRSRLGDFCLLGDSISARCSDYSAPSASATTQIVIRNDGYIGWAMALSGLQVNFDPRNNFGLGGDRLDAQGGYPGILSRVPSVIDCGVSNCVVLGGHNDVSTAGTPLSSMKATMKAICDKLVNAGITVYLMTLVPITGMGASQNAKLLAFNAWIRKYAQGTFGIVLVDPYPYINDYAAVSPQQKPYFTASGDTLHPGVRSSFYMGYALWKAAENRIPKYNGVIGSQGDLRADGESLNASLTANSALLGTGGTATTAGGATNVTYSSSNVAAGLTVQKYGGSSVCTISCTKENPRTDLDGFTNGERQVVSFSTTATGGGSETIEVNTATVTSISGAYSAGEQLYAECNIELTNPVNMYGVSLLLSENHTDGFQKCFALEYAGASANNLNALMESTARTYKYTLRTPILYANSDTQSLTGQVRITFKPSETGGASGTVKIGDLAIRKI
jgi:hypothetical protein